MGQLRFLKKDTSSCEYACWDPCRTIEKLELVDVTGMMNDPSRTSSAVPFTIIIGFHWNKDWESGNVRENQTWEQTRRQNVLNNPCMQYHILFKCWGWNNPLVNVRSHLSAHILHEKLVLQRPKQTKIIRIIRKLKSCQNFILENNIIPVKVTFFS